MSFIPQCGSSKLILIDVQEKLVPAMSGFETAAEKIRLLLEEAQRRKVRSEYAGQLKAGAVIKYYY